MVQGKVTALPSNFLDDLLLTLAPQFGWLPVFTALFPCKYCPNGFVDLFSFIMVGISEPLKIYMVAYNTNPIK